MAKRDDFYTVLTDAVNDILEHGYDKEERIAYWTERLRKSAERYLSKKSLDKILRDHLKSIYSRLVTNYGIEKYHFGVNRYTIDKIKPSLRSELDRRIMASANLIKLNRETAIQDTLQRFQGWSTSIPAGGAEYASRSEAKKGIRKSLSSMSFRERRVLIDQGHKLVSSINDIVAVDGGAIAAVWESHWRQSGYNYRPDHKERDGKVYAIRGNWALETGIMKKGSAGYTDEITTPGQEVYCRCNYKYIYNLRDLPRDMLTTRGLDALEQAREKIL